MYSTHYSRESFSKVVDIIFNGLNTENNNYQTIIWLRSRGAGTKITILKCNRNYSKDSNTI